MALGNLGEAMKAAKKMQESMQKLQQELEHTEVSSEAAGGLVKVVGNAKGHITKVVISPEAANEGLEVLGDLVVAALNLHKTKAEKIAQDKAADITKGLGLPKDLQGLMGE